MSELDKTVIGIVSASSNAPDSPPVVGLIVTPNDLDKQNREYWEIGKRACEATTDKDMLKSEIPVLEKMIRELPAESVIDRTSLENRKAEVEKQIEECERAAADLNAQAPAGIPSPSLDELAEQQGIKPVRTPADIPTLGIDEPDMPPAQEMIQRECRDIEAVLLDKNKAYGNSALDPVRIFSTADPIEQIRVRIDDKLSRIKRGQALGEDVTRDLVGYLILLRVAEKMKGSNCQ